MKNSLWSLLRGWSRQTLLPIKSPLKKSRLDGTEGSNGSGPGGQDGQRDQGQSGHQTGQQSQVLGAMLVEADHEDSKIIGLVGIDHPLYGRALEVGKYLDRSTTDNLFVDQDGIVVGSFMQFGPVIRAGVQVAVISGTLPKVLGEGDEEGDSNILNDTVNKTSPFPRSFWKRWAPDV
ncbi:hypothetical protein KCU67_g2965, partial [Aureobasidium melanogenum]